MLKWMNERFPPVTFITSLVLVALTVSYSRYLQAGHGAWHWTDLILTLAVWSQFLVLRVLDEHKDFADDQKFHPERVLQRGLISLRQLRRIGAVAFVFSLVVTLTVAPVRSVAFGSWLVMQGWTLLMAKEFFCGSFLRPRLFVYSVSHLLVLPLMMLWICTLGLAADGHTLSIMLPLMACGLINGLIYELARKTKGSDESHSGEVTFTGVWGVRGATRAIAIVMIVSFIGLLALGRFEFHLSWFYYLPAAATLVISLLGVMQFRNQPTVKSRKAIEGASALYTLAAYLTCISFVVLH